MVLSNKKLKEKLRAKFAEIAVSKTTDFKTPTNSEAPKSLKQLLDSTTPKPRLSKREKRRVNLSSLPKNNDIDDTHVEESIKGGRKRKREKEGAENGEKTEVKVEENGEILSERRRIKREKRRARREKKENTDVGDKSGVDVEKGVENGGKTEVKVEENGEILGERMRIKREKRKARREKKENTDESEKIGVDGEMGVENGEKIEGKVEENGEVLSERMRIKREKRRQRREKKENNDESEKNGVDVDKGVIEGSDLKKEVKDSVKNKKKKKKKKKRKNKKSNKEEKQSEVENAGISDQMVVETSEGNDDDRKKVYVGGMPYSSTEDDIWNYFDHCGAITDIDCLKFPDTGKFRGIAIISFKTEEAAEKALALDGSDMEGLFLKIQRYKATRTPKSTNFSPPVIEGYNRIYAGNLSWDIAEDNLRKFFSDCNISSIRFGEDKETGEFKGYAHVDFSDNDSLMKALKLDQKVVCGRPVKISRAVPAKGPLRNPTSISTQPQENNSGTMAKIPADNDGGIIAKAPAESSSVIMAAKSQENNGGFVSVTPQENTSGVSSGKLKRRTCYECGEKGHISSACPKKQATEQIDPSAS